MDLLTFLPLIIIMGAFMFFASRRQRKAMQASVISRRVGASKTSDAVGILLYYGRWLIEIGRRLRDLPPPMVVQTALVYYSVTVMAHLKLVNLTSQVQTPA
jgi:hypothetical protein